MQTTPLTDADRLRFQQYGYRLADKQLEIGESYQNLNQVNQIIFVNDKNRNTTNLTCRYRTVGDDGFKEAPYSVTNRMMIYIPMVEHIVKEKGIENLNEFEQLCYVFKNSTNNAIIKTAEKAVKAIMKQKEGMVNNTEWWSAEEAAQRGAISEQGRIDQAKSEAKMEGKVDLISQQIQFRYNLNAFDYLTTLSQQQLDRISKLIFSYDTFDELKQAVEGEPAYEHN